MAGYKLMVNQFIRCLEYQACTLKAKMIYSIGILYPWYTTPRMAVFPSKSIQSQSWMDGLLYLVLLCLSFLSFLVFVFIQGISCVVYDAGNDRCPPLLTSYTKNNKK